MMYGPTETGLVIEGLTVEFARWGQTTLAVDDLSFHASPGQWIVVVGPNGSGKSSLLRAIGRRLEPKRGQIWLHGNDLLALSPLKVAHHVFYVHQDPLAGTAPVLTVLENLLVAESQHRPGGERRAEAEERYRELLHPFGLGDRLHQPAKMLSGGERQLLALLIASLRPAGLVLLDEPTAALDPAKEHLCLEILASLHRDGKTLIQVSHDETHAVSLGDRTVALRRGRIVEDVIGDRRAMGEARRHWYD